MLVVLDLPFNSSLLLGTSGTPRHVRNGVPNKWTVGGGNSATRAFTGKCGNRPRMCQEKRGLLPDERKEVRPSHPGWVNLCAW